jgi:AcrR family transcriptional regulator
LLSRVGDTSPVGAPPNTSARPRTRRTQAERRAQTRKKLLDATIQSLLEVGYAATTTRRVTELAGVSQGAQTHHFPRRVDLVAAAFEELAQRRLTELHESAGEFPAEGDAHREALFDLLWSDFSSPAFTVLIKLWVAADDDPELFERLLEAERRVARSLVELILHLAGDLVQRPDASRRVQLVLSATRGLALAQRFAPMVEDTRDQWPELRQALLEALS